MSERYDIAIVGSGPAGLSAAINAKVRNKNFVIFGNKEFSTKLTKAPKINNYLGFSNVKGLELKEAFEKHINDMNINITYERVNNIYAMGDYYALMVNDKIYEANAVILATGIEYTKPIEGEERLLGKGVGYCATCDAPLYRDKIVTIVGYNTESEEEANYVSELAFKVYYVPMYKGNYFLRKSIEIVLDTPESVIGENKVEKLKLKNREILTDGIFFLRDAISPDQLVPGLEVEDGHIKVDRNMATNLNGCFAAGDCVGRPHQYIKAAGEGLIAALNAVSYVSKL